MNIARMYLWIGALRTRQFTCASCGQSQTYTQGRGTLEGTYRNGQKEQCCLGVGSYIAKLNGCEVNITGPNFQFESDTERRPTYFDTGTSFLPDSVRNWYGLESGNPVIPLLGETAALVNDGGYTFDDIAEGLEDMVRKELGLTPLVLPERRRCSMLSWTDSGQPINKTPCPHMTVPGSNKCARHNGVAYDTWDAEGNLIEVHQDAYDYDELVNDVADTMDADKGLSDILNKPVESNEED